MENNFELNKDKVFSIPINANAHPENIDNINISEENEFLKSYKQKNKKAAFNFKLNKLFSSTRSLSFIYLSIVTILAALLYNPIRLIFNASWKLNQQIDLFSTNKIQIGNQDWGFKNFFGEGQDLLFYFESTGFSLAIRYYSLAIFLGLVLGYFLSLYLAKKSHVSTSIIDRLLIGLVVFGLVGARLVFVLFNFSAFQDNLENIVLAIPQGGLSFFGAFIGAFIYLLIYVYRYRFNLWEFLDILAPGVLVGQILGRFGNFFNYEAYGPATSVYWKMFVPSSVNIGADINNSFFHPTFLYEIIPNCLLLFLILFFYEKLTFRRSGLVFAFYAVGYGVIRFITEFYRLDALKLKLPATLNVWIYSFEFLYVSQLMALGLFIFGIGVYLNRRKVLFIKKNLQEIRI